MNKKKLAIKVFLRLFYSRDVNSVCVGHGMKGIKDGGPMIIIEVDSVAGARCSERERPNRMGV